jgi:putative phage-type endonuclease
MNSYTLKLNFLRRIPQVQQKSAEWLEQRKCRLTSSDAATALGINKYETQFDLLLKKCNYGPKFTGNEATKHGEKYETEAINWYCKLINKKNHEFSLVDYDSLKEIRTESELDSLKETHFVAGSPDGVAEDLDNSEELVLLEVKCPMRRKIIFGQVPEYYYPQVQLNMAIFDLKKADFIEYIPKGIAPYFLQEPMINIVRVHRNDKWLLDSIPKLYEFWQQVVLYREIGIEKHPDFAAYKLKQEKSATRSATIATNKINRQYDFIDTDTVEDNVLGKIQFREDDD